MNNFLVEVLLIALATVSIGLTKDFLDRINLKNSNKGKDNHLFTSAFIHLSLGAIIYIAQSTYMGFLVGFAITLPLILACFVVSYVWKAVDFIFEAFETNE